MIAWCDVVFDVVWCVLRFGMLSALLIFYGVYSLLQSWFKIVITGWLTIFEIISVGCHRPLL